MKMIKFPSIEQFRTIFKYVSEHARFKGLDEDNKPIFDNTIPLPTVTFQGSVKLHGTNAGIGYDVESKEIWYMSRENIITPLKDNAGFAFFAESKKDIFEYMFDVIARSNDITDSYISIYGEWAGKGIQKSVGISEIEKSFFIFGLKVTPKDETKNAYWLDSSKLKSPDNKIFNINDFKTYSVSIDFNNPQLSINKILEMTLEVEEECPVAKEFGIKGIGEGIVFSANLNNGDIIRFKSKGEKHSNSKVKTLKPVDDIKEQLKIDIAQKVTHAWRIDQAIQEVCNTNNGGVPENKYIGEILKWVNQDILKEDSDIISESGLEPKDVFPKVAIIVKEYFFNIINKY